MVAAGVSSPTPSGSGRLLPVPFRLGYHLPEMAKFQFTKTIEAEKLNKRTLIPLGGQRQTIPFGGIVDLIDKVRDDVRFNYLGEPCSCKEEEWNVAAKAIE